MPERVPRLIHMTNPRAYVEFAIKLSQQGRDGATIMPRVARVSDDYDIYRNIKAGLNTLSAQPRLLIPRGQKSSTRAAGPHRDGPSRFPPTAFGHRL